MNLGTLILLVLVLAGVVMFFWLWSRTWNRGGGGSARPVEPQQPSSPRLPSRFDTLEPPEPPYTKSDGMVAPKFGSAGSGGAEHEPVGERRKH